MTTELTPKQIYELMDGVAWEMRDAQPAYDDRNYPKVIMRLRDIRNLLNATWPPESGKESAT